VTEPVRDLIGYGCNPPNPHWPGEARLALNFVLNYEEGSEYSIGDGDGQTDAQGDRGLASAEGRA
jgi:allantoinase